MYLMIGLVKILGICFGPTSQPFRKLYDKGILTSGKENKMKTLYEIGATSANLVTGYNALINCRSKGASLKSCVNVLKKMGYKKGQIRKMLVVLSASRPSLLKRDNRTVRTSKAKISNREDDKNTKDTGSDEEDEGTL